MSGSHSPSPPSGSNRSTFHGKLLRSQRTGMKDPGLSSSHFSCMTDFLILPFPTHRALQAGGLGRSAMSQTEAIAAAPPHSCTVAALDTMAEEYQLSEEHIRDVFDGRGVARPAKMRTNQEWYRRQGYELMPTEVPDVFLLRDEATGEVKRRIPIIWMKKELAS